MTGIINVALMGFFVWSGIGASALELPQYVAAPEAPAPKIISIRLTGYNAVPEQTDSSPETTASGVRSNPDVIAARSQDLADILPFGTIIALEVPESGASCGFSTVEHLIGYRVIADSMHKRKTRQVDVMFDLEDTVRVGGKATNPAVALGVCDVVIRVVGKVSIKDIPDTQTGLALLVNRVLAVR